MPNIMLTYRCNLHCPYCFANEFVNRNDTDISVSNFLKAVSFITSSGNADVGLIGGEPTLHPGFQTFVELLAANPKVSHIILYTNGLLMDRFIPQITHPKVWTLVNCNSPLITGEKAYERLRENLDELVLRQGIKDHVKLGINLYDEGMDYSYILELLQRYGMQKIRISLAVPDFSAIEEPDVIGYFTKYKQFLMGFFHSMDSIHVLPHYDCNHPPYCIWNDGEKEWLEAYVARYPECNGNLISRDALCVPAIDILPDLNAVRCFGMSGFLKAPIQDFACLNDLKNFFLNEIDSNAYKLSGCDECKDCYERKTRHCYAGCIGFKSSRIDACNKAIAQI